MKKRFLFFLVLVFLLPSVSLAANLSVSSRIIIRLQIDGEQYDLQPFLAYCNSQRLKADGSPVFSILSDYAPVIRLKESPKHFDYIALFDTTLANGSVSQPRLTSKDARHHFHSTTISAEEISSLGEGAWPILIPVRCSVPDLSARYVGYAAVWLLIGEDAALPYEDEDLTFGG